MGISLTTVGILIVRALSNGKVLKKHQYAFWIVIPVFMLLSPFIRFNIPFNVDLNSLFPEKTETVTVETVNDAAPVVTASGEVHEKSEYTGQNSNQMPQNEHVVINANEQEEVHYFATADNRAKKNHKYGNSSDVCKLFCLGSSHSCTAGL